MDSLGRVSCLTLTLLMLCAVGHAEPIDFGRLVEAVGKAENSVKYPYGVKSINTHGNRVYARQICLNSARNAWKRYAKGKSIALEAQEGHLRAFLEAWGDRWCPWASDPSGHRVWARNVEYQYNKGAM
jgi:hypothetical protein